MKKIRFALFLGVLCSTLAGCNNGGGGGGSTDHTITFNGENCFMRDATGDKPITEPIKVKDDSTANYVIYVTDTSKYAIPNQLDIKGDVTHTYSPNTDKQGNLKLEKIKSDITITAYARDISDICSIKYYSDSHCAWSKNNPGSITKHETLVANIDVESGLAFTVDNFVVLVEGQLGPLATDTYTYSEGVFTLKGEYVTGNITISAGYVPPQPSEYQVSFTMDHASSDFPTTMTQGFPLYGYITAEAGYRVPTKDELAPEGHQIDGTIIKKKPGVEHHLTQDQFYYENYIETETGLSKAYLLIYDLEELADAEEIIIGGIPVEQVTVTFRVKETGGHWDNPSKTTEDRFGTIDKGDEFGNAEKAASGTETPVIDDEGWSFDEWQDDNGTPYYSPTEINEDVVVSATFKQKEYEIYTDAVYHATITGLPTEPIHWHDPIGSELKPIKITAADGYKLPAKSLVKVTMNEVGSSDWHEISFNYIRRSDAKEADFYIGENIVEGDVRIELNADKYVSVTFDPGEGLWEDGTADDVTVTLPSGSTYGEALDLTGKGGNPSKSGWMFDSWRIDQTVIKLEQIITDEVDGATITAYYTENVTFTNDTWANVIAHADADDLKETYKDTIYIGATRTLTYNSKDYTVRLIDSDYDYYYKNGVATVSALTFEFVDLIKEDEYGIIPDTSLGSNNWENSTYRTFLNDDFYNAIISENEGFAPKKAIKYTLSGQGDTPLAMKETENYFFSLSGAEIGLAGKNNHPVNPTTYRDQQRENEGLSKGLAYYYYQNAAASRIKKLDGEATKYWLRSPHVYSDSEVDPTHIDETNCYYIYDTGGTSEDYAGWQYEANASMQHGYMAAFCI